MHDKIFELLHYGPQTCLQFSPESVHATLYKALVCGVSLPASESQRLLLDTGLIHLIVVSGAHLAFLDQLMERWPNAIRLFILSTYTWLTGFGPPVVRALARRVLANGAHRQGLSAIQLDFAAVVLSLLLWPEWIFSRSFLMSWMCGLALNVPIGAAPLRCYLFLFFFAPASPVSMLWNAIITPFVGNWLFPLCVLSYLVPPFTKVTDWLWDIFLLILQLGPQAPPQNFYLSTQSLFWLPLTVHGLLIWSEIRWRRKLAFSY